MMNEPVPVTEYYLTNIDRIASSRPNQSRRSECRDLTDKSVNCKKEPQTQLNKFLDVVFKHRLFRRFIPPRFFHALNRDKHYDFTRLERAQKYVRNLESLSYPKRSSHRRRTGGHDHERGSLFATPDTYTRLHGQRQLLPLRSSPAHKATITKAAFDYNTVAATRSTPSFEPTTDEVHLLHDLMVNQFDADLYAYDTLANLGEALMSYQCSNDVPQLASNPAVFIKQCPPRVCIQPAFGKPVHATGSLAQIDRNGSYTDFEDIPRGAPNIINPEKWREV